MSVEFDIRITDRDMYRFNMYHSYTGFQGIFATILGIAVLIVAVLTRGKIAAMYTYLYIAFGIVFLIYMPVSLFLRSKRQLLTSEALRDTLHYKLDEQGICVSQKGETASLPWKQVYKMIGTKSNLLIYSSRINAYVIPRALINEKYDAIKAMAVKYLKDYQMKL